MLRLPRFPFFAFPYRIRDKLVEGALSLSQVPLDVPGFDQLVQAPRDRRHRHAQVFGHRRFTGPTGSVGPLPPFQVAKQDFSPIAEFALA
jgi:hypothetical protein